MSATEVEAQCRALVLYESMFGNTAAVAGALGDELAASGLEVEVVDVSEAVAPSALDADLLVLGAPTHAFTLSRTSTREDAVRQGAAPEHSAVGVREWLTQARKDPPDRPVAVAAFDTRVTTVRHLPGSAAHKASRMARAAKLGRDLGAESFYVEDTKGPLAEGELERARAWGHRLAMQVSTGPRPR